MVELNEQMKASVLDRIATAIAIVKEKGLNPVLIVMHPKIEVEVITEVQSKGLIDATYTRKLFGLDICLNSQVKDFVIVDDRSWVHQN